MPFSVIKRKRTRQPLGSAKIDFSNSLAPDFAFNAASGNVIFGKKDYLSTRNVGGTISPGKYVSYKAARTADGGLDFGAIQPISGDKWTIMVLANPNSTDGVSTLFSQRNNSPYNQINLVINSSGGLTPSAGRICATVLDVANNSRETWAGASAYVDGSYHVYAISSAGATANKKLYVDGNLLTVESQTSTASQTCISSTMKTRIGNIGDYATNNAYAASCDIPLVLLWNRELSAADIARISKNPWQIFRAKRRMAYFDLADTADLAAAAQSSATSTGTISSSVQMSGASVVIASATGAVNQSVGLSGAAASVSVADGIVSITASLAGNGFVESFSSGALASALTLEASAQSAATAAADLSTGADLAGTAAAQAASTGSIGLSVSLSADSLIQALASADLDGGAANDLSGNAAILATATGGIMQDVPVLGSATFTVTGSGGVSSTMQLEGAAMVSALAGGDLQVSALGLSANAIIQALAGGSIEMTLSLSAAALAQALSVGTLTIGDLWSGAIIEKYTALGRERNYVAVAPERNYTATA